MKNHKMSKLLYCISRYEKNYKLGTGGKYLQIKSLTKFISSSVASCPMYGKV